MQNKSFGQKRVGICREEGGGEEEEGGGGGDSTVNTFWTNLISVSHSGLHRIIGFCGTLLVVLQEIME